MEQEEIEKLMNNYCGKLTPAINKNTGWRKILVKLKQFIKNDILGNSNIISRNDDIKRWVDSYIKDVMKETINEVKKEIKKEIDDKLKNQCPICKGFDIEPIYHENNTEGAVYGPIDLQQDSQKRIEKYRCKKCGVDFYEK